MRVAVLGASGFIGRRLTAALRARGDDVVEPSLRDPHAAARACEGADAVVNLAGEPIAEKRWSADVKEKIVRSRVDAPRALIDALRAVSAPPKAYLSASAIGYYGTSETETFTEASGPGDGFLAETCVAWEREAARAADLGMRVTIVRTGLVLGKDGGALGRLLPLFRSGAGGTVAGGKQWYSWIHLADAVGIYLMALGGVEGVLNATAPEPVQNREFTRALAHAVHRPAIVPVPAFAVGLILGEGATVVTEGQRVLPERTVVSGYQFAYPQLEAALAEIVG